MGYKPKLIVAGLFSLVTFIAFIYFDTSIKISFIIAIVGFWLAMFLLTSQRREDYGARGERSEGKSQWERDSEAFGLGPDGLMKIEGAMQEGTRISEKASRDFFWGKRRR